MLNLDFISNEYQDTKSPGQKVFESIAVDILTGVLPDGKQIVEQKFCEKYNMSRTPLREIIRDLQGIGLVRLIPNRGAFVCSLSPRDINDIFYMKSLLYPQCVRWAIERITDEEFAVLEEAFTFMEFYAATDDLEKGLRVIRGFNSIIYNASHDGELERTLLRYDFITRNANLEVRYPANFMDEVLEESRAIFEAFKLHSPDMGEEAAQISAYKSMARRK